MKNLINLLPSTFKELAIPLSGIGVDNVAWKYNDCIEVVNFLTKHGFFILGGDVYGCKNENINNTYDSWYINKNNLLARKDLIELGKSKTLSYIKKYKDLNGDDYCYSLVVE